MTALITDGIDALREPNLAGMPIEERRSKGITYTPAPIVDTMLRWARDHGTPCRVVDPGAGSGRFTIAAARAFPNAEVIAVENDPLSATLLRSNVRANNMERRVRVVERDYRSLELSTIEGVTLFIGNPPYVRHHDIGSDWKHWYAQSAARQGLTASKLAGLHLHFFLKTHELAKRGDYGCLITAAEWLDVNYGSTLRHLLTNGMGCLALDVFPTDRPAFPDVMTTAVITCFEVGASVQRPRLGTLVSNGENWSLGEGTEVAIDDLAASVKWSEFALGGRREVSESGLGRVGDLFRVSRGQVTGANSVWTSPEWTSRLPDRYCAPAVTRAFDLIANQPRLRDASGLRRVIDLPSDLVRIPRRDWDRIAPFIDWARSKGAHEGYVASHRAAWWSVGLYPPAPILVTYMGRRNPVFVRNVCGARHLNIAHGLYPRHRLSATSLDRIVEWLNQNGSRSGGRTYAGGLTKFEPREVECLPIPKLSELA